MLFCRHYVSPLNTFMRKGNDPERNQNRIRTSDYWIRIREAQKHADPDPQHWSESYLSRDLQLISWYLYDCVAGGPGDREEAELGGDRGEGDD